MIGPAAAHRPAPLRARDALLPVSALALGLLGYAAASDVRIAGACAAAVLAAVWSVVAYHHPRATLAMSVPMVLLAGTKFRLRDADASLQGALDAQVALELLLFALVGIGVAGAWLATRDGRRATRAEIVIGAYAAIALVSTLWSDAPVLTLVRATQLAILGALAIVAVRVLTPAGMMWTASRALAVWVLLCAAIAAALPWTTEPLVPDEGVFRFRWFAVHPLDAATLAGTAALALIAAAAFARTGHVPGPSGLRVRLAIVALAAVLALTSTRGPLLAFAAGLGVLWLMRARPALRAAGVLGTGVAAALALAFASDLRAWLESIAAGDSLATRLFFRRQTADTVFELNGRLGLWQELQPVVLDRLALGYGYQASRAAVLEVASWAAYAHNAFLQTALDLGLPGAVVVLLLVAMGVRAARRQPNPWLRVTIAALMVFVTVNAMSNESFAAAPDVELLLLFVCALAGSRTEVRNAMAGVSPPDAPGVNRADGVTR